MKPLFFKALSLAIVFSLISSCDKVNEVLDIQEFTQTFDLYLEIDVDVPKQGLPDQSTPLNILKTYNIAASSEVQEFVGSTGDIKEIEINAISYEIFGHSGFEEAALSGDFLVSDSSMSGGVAEFSIPNINLETADNNNTRYFLQGDLTGISNDIEEDFILQYGIDGTVSHNPSSFLVGIFINVSIKIEVN